MIAVSADNSDDRETGHVVEFPKSTDERKSADEKAQRVRAEAERLSRLAQVDQAQQSQQLRTRTAEDIANEQTAERLALYTWAALVGEKTLSTMSDLVDQLLDAHLLDDDDEETDESWLDDHRKHEDKLLSEAIADGLKKYPSIDAINNLPRPSDPDMARDAEQLQKTLAKCAIGATQFAKRFPRAVLERMVKRDIKERLERDPKYSHHIRADVPGSDIKKYGEHGRTSSKGTFAKAIAYEHGGDLAALLTGGWMRVAKDRIDPVAWSYQFGFERKSERQHWLHHYIITERSGKHSKFELKRETLHGMGNAAIKQLLQSGVHIIRRKIATGALVQFLGFKPKEEIVRMPRVGWALVEGHYVFVRPDEVLKPAGMQTKLNYLLDTTTRHGLHIAGTAKAWETEIAAPLAGNSNVALSLGTFFAAPVLGFAGEPGGGFHEHGPSTIGKTMVSDVGQSIYGWPHETADDAFGVSWAGSEAGFDALAIARTDLGLPLDEITLADQRGAEKIVYKLASGTKGPRATSTGRLRETAHANLLVFSTGEESLAQFVGNLQEGARKRLVDVPAEVQSGSASAYETIPRHEIHTEGARLFDAMKRQHGAVGREWQRHLVELGPDTIKADLKRYRKDFLAMPAVLAVADKAHPQVRAVVNRFALVAAALRMAIAAGLLPWTVEQADTGIVACMQRWVQQRSNIDTAGEELRAAHQIALAVAANLHQFIHLRMTGKAWAATTPTDEAKQQTPKRFDGYVKADLKRGDLILIRPEAWRRYCGGFDGAAMAQHFKQRNILIARGKGTTQSEQVIGGSKRFYVLRLTSLAG